MQVNSTSDSAAAPIVFMTVQRFCQERSLPRSTFYKQVKAGYIRPVKRGRRTLIHRTEADRYDNSLPAAVT
jgi:excisionase family DNA binding protein